MICAIIGNSGSLLGKKNFEKIDVCDEIIRLNNATNKGFEPDAGYRTTSRFLSFPCSANGEDFESTLENEKLYVTSFSHKKIIEYLPKVLDKNEVHIIPTEFRRYCDAIISEISYKRWIYEKLGKDYINITKKIASIGFIATMWALQHYSEVRLFGFDFFQTEATNYHYFEKYHNINHNPNKWHNFKNEKKIIEATLGNKLKIF